MWPPPLKRRDSGSRIASGASLAILRKTGGRDPDGHSLAGPPQVLGTDEGMQILLRIS